MSRQTFVLAFQSDRRRAIAAVMTAPTNARVEVKGPARSLDQNAKLHAMITEVSEQAEWAGKRRSVEDWKDLFTASVKMAEQGLEVVPGLTGGIMLLGLHTSDLEKEDFSSLIDYVAAWSAENGVVFQDEARSDQQTLDRSSRADNKTTSPTDREPGGSNKPVRGQVEHA